MRAPHRRASHVRISPIGHLIGVPLTGVHLRACISYACLSNRPSYRRASHRRISPIDGYLPYTCLSHRRASPIGYLIGLSLIGVSPIGHLMGVSLIGGSLIDVLLTGTIS